MHLVHNKHYHKSQTKAFDVAYLLNEMLNLKFYSTFGNELQKYYMHYNILLCIRSTTLEKFLHS